jgi:hypothetical protein
MACECSSWNTLKLLLLGLACGKLDWGLKISFEIFLVLDLRPSNEACSNGNIALHESGQPGDRAAIQVSDLLVLTHCAPLFLQMRTSGTASSDLDANVAPLLRPWYGITDQQHARCR